MYDKRFRCDYKRIAVQVLSQGRSLAALSAKIQVPIDQIKNWMQTNAEFAAAVEIGLAAGQDLLENKALDALEKKSSEFNSDLYKFIMKNRFREQYSDQKMISDASSLIEKLFLSKKLASDDDSD